MILVVGYSHLAALRNARQEQVGDAPDREFRFVQLIGHDQINAPLVDGDLHPTLRAMCDDSEVTSIVSALGGNAHHMIGLVAQDPPIDLVLPDETGLPLDDDATLLPSGLVRSLIERRLTDQLTLLEKLCGFGHPVIHVDEPPPIPSVDHITAHPGVFADVIEERGVAGSCVRYKLWRTNSAVWRDACSAAGAIFLDVPDSQCDEAGMLRPEAWNPDPTHGNASYGAAVLEQLRSEVTESPQR